MAKLIKHYKGFQIKEHTKRDCSAFKYIVMKGNLEEWEADDYQECIDFIDSY